MHIENMHEMIECLTCKTKEYLDEGLDSVDTDELGKVIDMIKDLNEASYYASMVKSNSVKNIM